jgi:hypothetical protein
MIENKQAQPIAVRLQVEMLPNSSKKKQRGGLMIGLAILLITSLAVVGFFAYQNYLLKNKDGIEKELITPPSTATQAPSPDTPETPLSTPAPDIYDGWSTYSGSCYSFKYPGEVTLTERKEENLIHLSLWGPTQKKETGFYDGISLTFSLPLDLGNLSLSDHVDSRVAENKLFSEVISPKQDVVINKINGYTYTTEGMGTFQSIFLQSDNKACAVEIVDSTKDPSNQGFQQTVNEILASFQFVK